LRRRRVTAVLLVVLCVWIAGFATPALHVGLLYMAPALLLAVVLFSGRYPGESSLALIAARLFEPRPSALRSTRLRRLIIRVAPRGTLLLSVGLAGRAPPHACGAATQDRAAPSPADRQTRRRL
jgi:hypothetical protein